MYCQGFHFVMYSVYCNYYHDLLLVAVVIVIIVIGLDQNTVDHVNFLSFPFFSFFVHDSMLLNAVRGKTSTITKVCF